MDTLERSMLFLAGVGTIIDCGFITASKICIESYNDNISNFMGCLITENAYPIGLILSEIVLITALIEPVLMAVDYGIYIVPT